MDALLVFSRCGLGNLSFSPDTRAIALVSAISVRCIGKMDEPQTVLMTHEAAAYSVLYVLLEDLVILSKPASRIIFGFTLLLAASAGLGVLSARWSSSENENLPAMRAPIQPPVRIQHRDMTPPPAAPSSGESTKAVRES